MLFTLFNRVQRPAWQFSLYIGRPNYHTGGAQRIQGPTSKGDFVSRAPPAGRSASSPRSPVIDGSGQKSEAAIRAA